MPTEKALTNKIKKHLESQGWLVIKIHGGAMQRAGLPDLLCLRDGRAVWLEVKTEEGVVSPLQKHWVGKLIGAGFTAEIVRSVEDVKRAIEKY